MSSAHVQLSSLVPEFALQNLVRGWLESDIPKFDAGGFVVGDGLLTARVLCKSPGVLSGIPFADAVFNQCGCSVKWLREEGSEISPEDAASKVVVAEVSGPACKLLQSERTALNILARSSGVASGAKEVAKLAAKFNWKGTICGTRKTTPGFSLVEKYSLLVGGAGTHRMDLSQMTMLKDNHIWAVGNITKAVTKARSTVGFSTKIEVECRNIDEAIEAILAGADIVMLDNFTPEEISRDAQKLKSRFPHVVIEASGGITLDTIPAYFSPHVDVISQGCLTQGYGHVDFSMKLPRPSHMAQGAT